MVVFRFGSSGRVFFLSDRTPKGFELAGPAGCVQFAFEPALPDLAADCDGGRTEHLGPPTQKRRRTHGTPRP